MTDNYTNAQISDAKKLAQILTEIPAGKRSLFSLMLESMILKE